MKPRVGDLALHVARISLCATGVALASRIDSAALAAAAGGALFFAAFALMHDVAHGALRLPRRANEIALTLSAALMLMSGHALRIMHLRHHARPLAPDDIEGAPARLPLLRALLGAPLAAVALRAEAFRAAGPSGRRCQLAEAALNLASLALLLASRRPALLAVAGAAAALQLTMAVWAAYIPHNAPAWMLAAARRLAFTRSPIALSLGYHERHHRIPGLPCSRLALPTPDRR
ncbi:fatty acid desaturase [Sorangium sp. So ce321]|uniref:fatty acid desaturase n=1 Tax=Sorangium sp. So ce321 TaxID=3133300 RepID=UPI003F61F57E